MLYRLAAETGLRRNELRSLTRAAFDLDAKVVTVTATNTKNRKTATLPLRPEMAEELRTYLDRERRAAPKATAFPCVPQATAMMLRADLAAADIPYEDERGRVFDFHALRHLFITNLARGGVAPKVAQALARHSTPVLTLAVYTHAGDAEQRAAVEQLPNIG